MGGSVGYSSAPGRGSIFYLRLPLEVAVEATQTSPAAGAGRVLVVEDIRYNARALGRMLQDLGFDPEFAEDGEAALGLLCSSKYRIVFVDCDLPRVDGFEVARCFREKEALGIRALVVATTAYLGPEWQSKCAASGIDACMIKPITPEKLQALLFSQGYLEPAAETPRKVGGDRPRPCDHPPACRRV